MHHAYNNKTTRSLAGQCANYFAEFTNILSQAEISEKFSEKDMKKMHVSSVHLQKVTISLLKKSGVNKDVIKLLQPILKGEYSSLDNDEFFDAMVKHEHNLENLITNIKKDYAIHKSKKLATQIKQLEKIKIQFSKELNESHRNFN